MYKCSTYLGCSGKAIVYATDRELKFEECTDCGLIWRTPDSFHHSKAYDKNYFDSKRYEKRRNHKVRKSGWLIEIAQFHHEKISHILEVGCSIGYTLEAAKKRNIKHLGIDVSEYAVDFCNKLGLNASTADFNNLRAQNKKYDLIFMQHVLEHFEDPFYALSECHSLLNKNGLILILVPNSKYYRAIRNRSEHRFYSQQGVGSEHFVYFNYKNLKRVLEVSGFKIVQKNYPVFTGKFSTPASLLNQIFRRLLSILNADQELFLVAVKR